MSEDNPDKPIPEVKNDQNNIILKRSTYKKLVLGIILSLIAVSFFGGYILGSHQKENVLQNLQFTDSQVTKGQQTTPSRVFVTAGDNPMEGNKDATITMVEFSDFQCPFCGAFYSQTLPQIQKDYIDSGKVKLVFRDFPLVSIHQNANAAALAAQCANEQGKFWEYHDMLFSSQRIWASMVTSNATDAFKQYAMDLGLDSETFNSCFDSLKYQDKINQNVQDGMKYSVSGTPTFFIGDDKKGYIQIVGAKPYLAFKQVIDQQLQ